MTPQEALRRQGFDLAQPFSRRALPGDLALPEAPGDLGLLIGNTHTLWPHLLAWLSPQELSRPDPLDRFVELRLTEALPGAVILWAHRPDVQGRYLPIQRLAQRCGLAALSPAHLSAHPTFGPWIALRAVALLDAPAPAHTPPPALAPCQGCPAPCAQALQEALGQQRQASRRDVQRRWRAWHRVREVCPVGRQHSYSLAQAAYHYTCDTAWLRAT